MDLAVMQAATDTVIQEWHSTTAGKVATLLFISLMICTACIPVRITLMAAGATLAGVGLLSKHLLLIQMGVILELLIITWRLLVSDQEGPGAVVAGAGSCEWFRKYRRFVQL
jgi:Fe2+ transport system protein B